MRPRLVVALAAFLAAGCESASQRELAALSARTDPAELALEAGFNDYVDRTILSDGTEVGVIRLADGSSSRFWFRSHHLTDDEGGTLFRFSAGTDLFMSGYFCCEVQLPEQQLGSLDELRAFVRDHDGLRP